MFRSIFGRNRFLRSTGRGSQYTVEGFWSLVKNGVRGVYHSVGKGYLQSYLNEYSFFGYNRRFDVQPMFTSLLNQIEKRDVVVRRASVIPEPF